MPQIYIEQCISGGWAALKKHPAEGIVGALIYLVICIGMGLIGLAVPFLDTAVSLVIAGPLVGGLTCLFLNMVMERNPQIGDVFKGFSRFTEFLIAHVLLNGCFVPGALMMTLAKVTGSVGLNVFAVLLTLAGLAVYLAFLLPRYGLAFFLLADTGCSVAEAFKQSEVMTRGCRGSVLGMFVLAGLIAAAGAIACGIGILFTIPLAGCAVTVMYRTLKHPAAGQDIPTATIVPPQGPAV
jgi:hypothetical protein